MHKKITSAMEIVFVTTNKGKMEEAGELGARYGIEFIPNGYDAVEMRSDDPEEIAAGSARDAYAKIRRPLIVEDSGLFIDALKGFPGTYSAFVFRTIGLDGVLRVMDGRKNRKATMRSAVAYADGESVKTFTGEVRGRIPEASKGSGGFGYDPVFIPEDRERTFGEDLDYKSRVSHRAQSIRKFCEWYGKQ